MRVDHIALPIPLNAHNSMKLIGRPNYNEHTESQIADGLPVLILRRKNGGLTVLIDIGECCNCGKIDFCSPVRGTDINNLEGSLGYILAHSLTCHVCAWEWKSEGEIFEHDSYSILKY